MRIAVISTPIFKIPLPGYGGLEQIAYEQAAGLAALGHDVLLVAPDGSTCPGVQVVPCGPAGQIDERMAWTGFPEHKDGDKVVRRAHAGYWQALLNVDVVIDHSWMKWSYSLKAEGRLKAPVLGWFHAPVNTMYQQWPPAYPRLPIVEKACPVCISNDQVVHFVNIYNRVAECCYNGFDPNLYQPIHGMKRTDRYLFLARFSTIKGPLLAIEACLRAGVGLDLVGDTTITNEPHYLGQCLKAAEQQSPNWDSSKGRQIVIHGGCHRGETVTWYSKARALLHLNRDFREPFGLAPVEAQACGLPVLAWDYGAMRETICKHSGILVKSLEEVDQVLQTNALDKFDREVCRENALRFTTERMIRRVEELCQKAVKTGGW